MRTEFSAKTKAAAASAPEPTPTPAPQPEVVQPTAEEATTESEQPTEPEKKKTPDMLRSEIRTAYSEGCRAEGGMQYKEFFRSTLMTHGGVDAGTATGISVQRIPEENLEACLADLQSYVA